MTSFQDAPDELMEVDEAMEERSSKKLNCTRYCTRYCRYVRQVLLQIG